MFVVFVMPLGDGAGVPSNCCCGLKFFVYFDIHVLKNIFEIYIQNFHDKLIFST